MGDYGAVGILGTTKVFAGELINAAATVASAIFKVETNGYFGVWYKATSVAGAPDIKIEFQMSYDITPANFVEPDGASDIETNLITETAHVKSFAPPPMTYLRFFITGNVANPADTLLTMYLFAQ